MHPRFVSEGPVLLKCVTWRTVIAACQRKNVWVTVEEPLMFSFKTVWNLWGTECKIYSVKPFCSFSPTEEKCSFFFFEWCQNWVKSKVKLHVIYFLWFNAAPFWRNLVKFAVTCRSFIDTKGKTQYNMTVFQRFFRQILLLILMATPTLRPCFLNGILHRYRYCTLPL